MDRPVLRDLRPGPTLVLAEEYASLEGRNGDLSAPDRVMRDVCHGKPWGKTQYGVRKEREQRAC